MIVVADTQTLLVTEPEVSVVVEVLEPEVVTVAEEVSVVTNTPEYNVVVVEALGNVITEVPTSTVVITGLMGPRGEQAEDLEVYSKRTDFVTDNEIYRGEAIVGSSEGAAVWRIRKITIAEDGDVTELWASGTSAFTKSWTLRSSYVYS